MTYHNSKRKQKLNRVRRGLALGLALPCLFVFSLSAQAQTSKISNSKKTTFGTAKVVSPSKSVSRFNVAKPSSGIRSSVSKPPGMSGSRVSRTDSIGRSSKPTTNQGSGFSLNRSSGDLRSETTNRGSIRGRTNSLVPSNPGGRGQVRDFNRGGTGSRGIFGDGRIGTLRPPTPPVKPEQLGRRLTIPEGLSRFPGPVTNLVPDLSNRIPKKTKPDLGNFQTGRKGGSLDIGKPGNLSSITDSNRKFDNILGSISKLKPKPLDIKDIGKELNKLTLTTKDKPALNIKRQEMVMGARKTMGLRFGVGAGCHWWADLLCGWHWHRHGCHWTDLCAVPGYWSCWRPCHYRVVWCPTMHGHVRSAWYFGIESFLIPDMHALGVHEVSPYSPAAMAGLQPGDMILSVNGYAFDNESVLPEMIQTSGGVLNLEVFRDGLEGPISVQVRLRRLRITSH